MKHVHIVFPLLIILFSGCRMFPDKVALEWRHASREEVTIRYGLMGKGPAVVMIPSLGRGAEDFFDLAERLARAGYRIALPQPRGIGGSTGPMENLTLHNYADDIALVIDDLGGGPVTLIGHALGNRIARATASDYPDQVDRVVLLAAGGMVPIPPAALKALRQCFELSLPEEERLAAIKLAFFAKGNDPRVWIDGWYPEVAQAQMAAVQATNVEEWWGAGRAQLFIIEAAEDAIAPPENAAMLKEEYGERVTVRRLENAGHAMLPEQPKELAELLIQFLGE